MSSDSPFASIIEDEEIVTNKVDDSVFDEIVEVEDPTADSDIAGRPPEAGTYILRYELGEKGVIKTTDRKGRPYVQLYIQAEIVDEGGEYHGYKVFYPSPIMSLKFGNRPTTPLHSFLHKIGHDVPMVDNGQGGTRSMTVRELADYTEEIMSQKPLGKADLDWRISYKTKTKEGKDDYPVQLEGMENIQNAAVDENYDYIVESEKDGSPLAAQVFIKKFVQQ